MARCPERPRHSLASRIGAGGKVMIPEPHASLQRRLLGAEGIESEGARIDMKLYAWTSGGHSKQPCGCPGEAPHPEISPLSRAEVTIVI